MQLSVAAREALTGSFEDRMCVAVLAIMPTVAILNESGCEGDLRVVEDVRPADYSPALWTFVVRNRAAKLLRSDAFAEAYPNALERVRSEAASAG